MPVDSLITRPAAARWLPFVYAGLSAVLLGLYSSWGRPIWYDESVYFDLGGLGSLADVIDVVRETTTNVNQGVTGAYMVADWGLLTSVGASAVALRLPSLLAAALMLWAGWIFLRTKGVGWVGLLALPVVLAGQASLMNYAGEARTYMPLAAATVGLLAYYSTPVTRRRSIGVRACGWTSLLVGVLFHPYLAVYWPAVLIFAWAVAASSDRAWRSWRALLRFANPWMIGVGAVLYVVIASLTWARGKAAAAVDPLFWLTDPVWKAQLAHLFAFLYTSRVLVLSAMVLVLLLAGLAWRATSSMASVVRAGLPPVALIALSYLLASVISLVSYQQGFWIIPRQWIGSMALIALAVIWLVSVLYTLARSRFALVSRAMLAGCVVVVLAAAAPAVATQVGLLTGRLGWTTPSYLESGGPWTQAELRRRLDSGMPLSEQDWVTFGQANIAAGGPVWPEFARYYADRDWSTFTVEDGTGS